MRNDKNRFEHLADEDLVALAQKGEMRAFELVYDRHSQVAFSLARRIVGTQAAAEDVMQEALLAIWRAIERFDGNRGSVRTWILKIVHRRAIDALRSSMVHTKRRAEGEGLLEGVEALEAPTDLQAVRRDEARIVRAVLDQLPADQHKVIDLAYFGGFTHSEISELLEIPIGTVKGRMRLGLEKMRTALDNAGAAEAMR